MVRPGYRPARSAIWGRCVSPAHLGEAPCQASGTELSAESAIGGQTGGDVNEDRFPRRRPRTAHQSEPRPQLVRSGAVLAPGRRSRRRRRPRGAGRRRRDRRAGRARRARCRASSASTGRRSTALGFDGKAGQTLVVPRRDGADLVAIGTGSGQLSLAERPRCRGRLRPGRAASTRRWRRACTRPAATTAAAAQAVVEGVLLARYRFESLKSDGDKSPLQSLTLARHPPIGGAPSRPASPAAGRRRGRAMLARDLANSPPSHLTATRLAALATEVGKATGLGVEVFERRPPRRARLRRSARRQRREHRAAVHDQADVPAEARRRRAAPTSPSSARGSCTTPAASASSRVTRCTRR